MDCSQGFNCCHRNVTFNHKCPSQQKSICSCSSQVSVDSAEVPKFPELCKETEELLVLSSLSSVISCSRGIVQGSELKLGPRVGILLENTTDTMMKRVTITSGVGQCYTESLSGNSKLSTKPQFKGLKAASLFTHFLVKLSQRRIFYVMLLLLLFFNLYLITNKVCDVIL